MALTQTFPNVSAMSAIQLLELMSKPEDMRQALLNIAKAEEELKARRAEARKQDAALQDTERQLAERKSGLDTEWAKLKAAQVKLDDAREEWRVKQAGAEQILKDRAAEHKAQVERDKADLAGERKLINDQQAALDDYDSRLDKRFGDMNDRERALEAREAAVAERETAANELAALVAKVKG